MLSLARLQCNFFKYVIDCNIFINITLVFRFWPINALIFHRCACVCVFFFSVFDVTLSISKNASIYHFEGGFWFGLCMYFGRNGGGVKKLFTVLYKKTEKNDEIKQEKDALKNKFTSLVLELIFCYDYNFEWHTYTVIWFLNF